MDWTRAIELYLLLGTLWTIGLMIFNDHILKKKDVWDLKRAIFEVIVWVPKILYYMYKIAKLIYLIKWRSRRK